MKVRKCIKSFIIALFSLVLCAVTVYGNENQFSGINILTSWEEKQLSDTFFYYIDDEIVYIKLAAFQKDSSSHFKSALKDVDNRGIQKVILDLRNNQGGIIDESIKIAGMIVPEGKICTVIQSSGKKAVIYSSTNTDTKYETVVLTNAITASSAELLTSAIKESGAGIIIGVQTYGKSSIQKITLTGNGEEFSETVGKYLTRGGEDISGVGIIPNYEIFNEYKTYNDFKLEELSLENERIALAVKQRLFLLGYEIKSINTNNDENYQACLKKFQYDNELSQTGILDTSTIDKLKELENTIVVLCDKQLEKAIEYLVK